MFKFEKLIEINIKLKKETMSTRCGKKVIDVSLYFTKTENIFPCNGLFCKCIEYLNFGKQKDLIYYRQCYITAMNNKKYEIKKYS